MQLMSLQIRLYLIDCVAKRVSGAWHLRITTDIHALMTMFQAMGIRRYLKTTLKP